MTTTSPKTYAATVADQPLATTLASFAVIAVTASLLARVDLPDEIVVSIAGGSGALVPAIGIRLAESRKPRRERIDELTDGRFRRSGVQMAAISAAVIVFVEYGASFLSGATAGVMLAGLVDFAGVEVSEPALLRYFASPEFTGVALAVAALWTMAVMVPLGVFVSHRVPRRAFLWILAAIVASQVVELLIELLFLSERSPNPWLAYSVYVPLLALPAWVGHRWARRTQPLFLMKRLYRQLSPGDRQAVMALMRDASSSREVPEPVTEGSGPARP